MPRSIYCSTCKKEKESNRQNTGQCKSCFRESENKRRREKRLATGLPPYLHRPKENCRCGTVKENIESRECHECRRKRDNEWRLKTGRTLRHRTGKCQCGKPFASYSGYLCVECYKKIRNDKREDPEYALHVLKDRVRSLTRSYISRGILIKGTCEACGTNENIDAHHDDYAKPMDIRWLCKKHHREHHLKDKI